MVNKLTKTEAKAFVRKKSTYGLTKSHNKEIFKLYANV